MTTPLHDDSQFEDFIEEPAPKPSNNRNFYIAIGMKWYARVQKFCFWGGLVGLLIVFALLLFGKQPQRWLPNATTCGRTCWTCATPAIPPATSSASSATPPSVSRKHNMPDLGTTLLTLARNAIASRFGLSLGEADVLRKAVGKKIQELIKTFNK